MNMIRNQMELFLKQMKNENFNQNVQSHVNSEQSQDPVKLITPQAKPRTKISKSLGKYEPNTNINADRNQMSLVPKTNHTAQLDLEKKEQEKSNPNDSITEVKAPINYRDDTSDTESLKSLSIRNELKSVLIPEHDVTLKRR